MLRWAKKSSRYYFMHSRWLSSVVPELTASQTSLILRRHEKTVKIETSGSVKEFECNYLSANKPVEDRYFAAHSPILDIWIFGVIDGHGGSKCANLVKTLLPHYIISTLLPRQKLLENIEHVFSETFCTFHQDSEVHRREIQEHTGWVRQHVARLLDRSTFKSYPEISVALCSAFEDLDLDISNHVRDMLPAQPSNQFDSVHSLFTGCCATVAYFDGINLHVANAGDCRALLIYKDFSSSPRSTTYGAKKLTFKHSVGNSKEVSRILSQHPRGEGAKIIKNDRLFGVLIPLRSFGNYVLKWPVDEVKHALSGLPHLIPDGLLTPPYLTATPDVTHHCLNPRDMAVVLASDGLWDMLTSSQVAQLVGSHDEGRQSVEAYDPNKYGHTVLSQILSVLRDRKHGLSTKPVDGNAATHLIRNSLAYTDMGIDQHRLSSMLGLPAEIARHFRDDISVNVIHLNSEYINHPDLVGTGFGGIV